MGSGNSENPFGDIRQFEWDENKRESNLRRHKIDFLDATRTLERPFMVDPIGTMNRVTWFSASSTKSKSSSSAPCVARIAG